MTAILDTVGTQTYGSFSSAAAGTDYVSRYIPRNRYASPITGAIGGGYQRPIMFRYLQIYDSQASAASRDLEIATAATGGGGTQSNGIGSDADADWANYDVAAPTPNWWNPLMYACLASDAADAAITYYYGIYKNDANTAYYYTGASANTSWNPANVYTNGTVSSAYPSRVLAGRIGWFHIPTAPTGFGINSVTSTSANFYWTAPSDDGGMAVNGYRIAFQYYYNGGAQGWWVWGGGTNGSPSGTTGTSQAVYGFPSNCYMDVAVAGLNGVSDRHNGGRPYIEYSGTTALPVAGGNYTSTAAHTGSNVTGSYRTLLAAPTVSGSYANTAKVNQPYSSAVTFSQDMGYYGGGNGTLTYSVIGSLPTGLSLSGSTISGTPTTPGTYSFTVRATNGDGQYSDSSQTITVGTLGPKVVSSNGGTPTGRATVKIHNGSTFVAATIKVHNGTTWTYLK